MRWILPALGVVTLCGMGCNRVRPIRSPADDVDVHIARKVPALPDDCEVLAVDADCHLDAARAPEIGRDRTLVGLAPAATMQTLRVTCDHEPPREAYVGSVKRCMWPGTRERFLREVCRAGGDTIVHSLSLTDSCIEEAMDDESLRGTSIGFYSIYRLRH
jgi:hypothetical protein